jgi:SdpC family antimicrobial peptide
MKKKFALLGVVVGAALTVTTGIAAPALASGTSNATVLHTNTAAATRSAATYTDNDVVALLVFGSGPIAQKYPELAKTLNDQRTAASGTPAQIRSFTEQLLAVDPEFHADVTLGVQSNDPYASQQALARLDADITTWYKQQNVHFQKNTAAQPQGAVWLRQTVVVATTVAGGWQAVVFTTVGGFAEAVVVVAIVPAAASYQFQYTHADKLEVSDWAANLAGTLG